MEGHTEKELLRFSTAGSVDDGKSTLIGRLLYETGNVFEDQIAGIKRDGIARGQLGLNLAWLTDGLRSERDQNITIDVAYRYFETPKRRFIIADTPGHFQYTRNMVTGASTAEVAIILIDARVGLKPQSKRHAFIASELGVPHVVVAINKMDLVGFSEPAYERIRRDYMQYVRRLNVGDVTFIPMSALLGENVAYQGDAMPWYGGPSLLHYLDSVNVGATQNAVDFRFPVQNVLSGPDSFRGYAGQVASGSIAVGDEVAVLPSRQFGRIKRLDDLDGEVDRARVFDSIVLSLEGELDVSRGDMIVRRRNVPTVSDRFDAMLFWLNEAPLDRGLTYVMMHCCKEVSAVVSEVVYRIDVDSLHREGVETLAMNDVGRVHIKSGDPVFWDEFEKNRATGSFILVHPETNETVAAGTIRGAGLMVQDAASPRSDRTEEAAAGTGAAVVWLTGLSGAGKSTIAHGVEKVLRRKGLRTAILDGDPMRSGLSKDLGFSPEDRSENIRRAGEVAKLLYEQGTIVVCAFVSPYAADRAAVRSLIPPDRFIEVHVACSVDAARNRDTKGLYARAYRGEITGLTGVSAPYEVPEAAELELDSTILSEEEAVQRLVWYLESKGLISQ